MKNISGLLVLLVTLAVMLGCGHQAKSFEAVPAETISHGAHFPKMDTNGDELVSWAEFKNQFPAAEKNVYESIDINKDSSVDHDEWHEFKSASTW